MSLRYLVHAYSTRKSFAYINYLIISMLGWPEDSPILSTIAVCQAKID